VKRRVAFLLVAIGLVAMVTGVASGCGSLFSFNGRHPVAVEPLVPGVPLRKAFPAKAGKRYTLAIQVVFEREGLPEANGQVLVEARLPLVATVEDTSGVAIAKAVGWIDPNEPPTVLLGRASESQQRRPMGAPPAELVAERLLGPVHPAVDRDVTYTVDLGTDSLGKAGLKEARLVLYDDTLPRSIAVAFTAAGAGAIGFVTGSILLFFGLFRSTRGGKRRGQVV
jgi:hypothetical protein